MTKSPIDYKNGKIYIIRNHINDKVYIGSTTQTLSKRFSWHKSSINKSRSKNYPLYIEMKHIGVEKFYIELLEEYPCSNIEQLHKREGHLIRQYDSFNNGYNGRIEGRSSKEWYEENKQSISKKYKEWRSKNINQRLLYEDNYKKENKERIKAYFKQYREDNKAKISLRMKEYYQKHKDEINKKITCDVCHVEINRNGIARHCKSRFHLSSLTN
jgi:hypothetical protein